MKAEMREAGRAFWHLLSDLPGLMKQSLAGYMENEERKAQLRAVLGCSIHEARLVADEVKRRAQADPHRDALSLRWDAAMFAAQTGTLDEWLEKSWPNPRGRTLANAAIPLCSLDARPPSRSPLDLSNPHRPDPLLWLDYPNTKHGVETNLSIHAPRNPLHSQGYTPSD